MQAPRAREGELSETRKNTRLLTKEKFERQYPSIKAMPSVVLAARICQAICAQPRTPDELTGILAEAIDQIRVEYRKEGDIEEFFCVACKAITTWRVEKLVGMETAGDFIQRCTLCGKVKL
jgi:hypothetical protein